ncbi:uncharacterized protein VTP21DRAFT_10787 [Calcarisporiella thermophila]|uniref:uncharacterized protein n=1 Tax=Calcarisporiella thermophila TaxID=911321 RepID=UPI003742C108
MATRNPLPTFRGRASNLVIPRRFHLPLLFLRVLSLAPAAYGALRNLSLARSLAWRNNSSLLAVKSTEMDFYLGAAWCCLAGLWSWWLTNGMLRRWFYHYELGNVMVRLLTLVAVYWALTVFVTSHYGPDQPVWAWMVICLLLATANVFKTLFISNPKYHHKSDGLEDRKPFLISAILRTIVIPSSIVMFVTLLGMLHQQAGERYAPRTAIAPVARVNATLALSDLRSDAHTKILVLVISSWTQRSFEKRQAFRDTTLRLRPQNSDRVSMAYRFVVGEPPSASAHLKMGPKISAESERYGDILMVASPDTYTGLSRKFHKGLEWAGNYNFDYLIKTDDDIFARLDVISKELSSQPHQSFYWRGLGYWNIPPIHNKNDKNCEFDYTLPMFPPFTAGALYILSRDIIDLLVSGGPRLYTKNEDQNLGIWLYPHNIRPIHDRRIQQADVCEDDMIAKHFSDSYEPRESMYAMYENIVSGRRMCEGFRQKYCAVCYPCRGRVNHWRDWKYDCDEVKGITLLRQEASAGADEVAAVKDAPEQLVIGQNDAWIVPDLLSQQTSVLSETEDWHLLHWVCWTTPPSTFMDRHYKTLELVWAHQPRAIIFMLTTTLPPDFFDAYRRRGFRIHIIPFGRDLLLERNWYLGPNSKAWVRNWDRWANSRYFFSHLTDYMRYLLLYRYGGMYMDMDALWIRAPPSDVEFIGADRTNNPKDRDWTLDGENMYVAPGVMRFRKGWSIFREVAESAFSPHYSPECFNCVGPRAITSAIRQRRQQLENNGFTILPTPVLYPLNYMDIHRLLKPSRSPKAELQGLEESSWSIHLFGKMTNGLPVESGSVVEYVFERFGLGIPVTAGARPEPFKVVGPTKYTRIVRTPPRGPFGGLILVDPARASEAITGKQLDAFQGLDIIYCRGGAPSVAEAVVAVRALKGWVHFEEGVGRAASKGLTQATPNSNVAGHRPDFRSIQVRIPRATQADVNALLSTLRYRPPQEVLPGYAGEKDLGEYEEDADLVGVEDGEGAGRVLGTDELSITVEYGDAVGKLAFEVDIVAEAER